LTNGKPFIAEAGMEDDKRGDRNLAKPRVIAIPERTFYGLIGLHHIPDGGMAPDVHLERKETGQWIS
jgi:hypothetical protein